MDYIINPAWFYWIEVADTIKAISIGAMVILLIASIVLAATAKIDHDFHDDDECDRKKTVLFICLVGIAVSSLVCIFTPSRNTLIEMQIAKLATKGNVELTIDKVKEIVDYIINAMKEMK